MSARRKAPPSSACPPTTATTTTWNSIAKNCAARSKTSAGRNRIFVPRRRRCARPAAPIVTPGSRLRRRGGSREPACRHGSRGSRCLAVCLEPGRQSLQVGALSPPPARDPCVRQQHRKHHRDRQRPPKRMGERGGGEAEQVHHDDRWPAEFQRLLVAQGGERRTARPTQILEARDEAFERRVGI